MVLDTQSGTETQPTLSPDGSHVALEFYTDGRRGIRVRHIQSGSSREICNQCGTVESWTPEGKGLYCISPDRRSVFLLDVAKGTRTQIINSDGRRFLHSAVSPDSSWLAVTYEGNGSFLYRLRAVESMHWSREGDALYYFSNRDDFRCLMSRRIHSATGVPAGGAQFVRHFHGNRHTPWGGWISVERDRLVFALTDTSANVFTGRLAPSGRKTSDRH